MMKWKGTEEVRLEEIKQVTEANTVAKANEFLKNGWMLLSVGVVPLGNVEGEMKGSVHWAFGRKDVI